MYEQMSLFNGTLIEICDTKPEIGSVLIFHYSENEDYECVVHKHTGGDYFYVKFLESEPGDNHPEVSKSGGWHLSIRGYKKDWSFVNGHLKERENTMYEKSKVMDINPYYDLAAQLLQFSKDENYYEFLDNVPDEESMLSVVYNDLKSGNVESYIVYIKEALYEGNMELDIRVDAAYLLFQLEHIFEYKEGIVSAVDLVLNNGKTYTYYFPYNVMKIDIDEMDTSRTAIYKTDVEISDTLVAKLHNAFTGTELEKEIEKELKIHWVMSIYENAEVSENENMELTLANRPKRRGR